MLMAATQQPNGLSLSSLVYLDDNPKSHIKTYDRRKEGKGISAVLKLTEKE